MDENALSNKIIGSAIEVHKILGPGLLESAYQECLNYELAENGFYVLKEKVLPVVYKDIKLEHGYRVDLLVNEKVVVELKSVEEIIDLHIAQVLTYMKLGDHKLGLILNFNETTLRKGIKRLIR
jgi:GxxExxY protein